jgi:hypothetical protein
MKRVSILLIGSLLALTACGGGGGGDGVASASGGAASAKPGSSSGSSLAPDQAQLKYAQCVRDNGAPNYPDDSKKIPNGFFIPEKAVKACEKWAQAAGGKTIDPNDPQTRDRFLKLSRCMRAHGIDWPDPNPGSLGGPPPDLSGTNKPKVTAALKICQKGWPTGN